MGRLRRQWWYLTLPRRGPDLPEHATIEIDADELERVLSILDQVAAVKGEKREEIWAQLPRGAEVFPYFLKAYPRIRRHESRHSVVYEATFFARVSEEAFQLAVLGCSDRSKFVRDRACGALAYSLRPEALPVLRPLLRDPDPFVREAAENAVHAVKAQDHSLFYGGPPRQTIWVVNRGDDPTLPGVGRDIEAEL